MANFCSNCAAQLAPDARFCSACNQPVSSGGTFPSAMGTGVQAVRSALQSPSMKVEPAIWAGVIEMFWLILTLGGALIFSVISGAGMLMTGAPNPLGRGTEAERLVFWLVLSSLYYVAQLAFQVPLVYGFFAKKHWAYGLFLWSVGPIVVLGFILRLAAPGVTDSEASAPLSFTLLSVFSIILNLALLGLQTYLVVKSKDQLVN